MIPRHRTSLILATLVVASAFVTLASPVAAGARPAADDAGRVSKSGDELAKAGSAKFRGTTSSAGGGNGGTVTFDGSLDFTSRAAEYSVDAAAIGLQGTGKVRTVVAGGVLYLSLDAVGGIDPSSSPDLAGKKWLKLDPKVFGGGGQIGQSDPNGSLDALRGVKGDVKRVGSEKVRGTRTTRYRATIDADQAVNNAPEAQRDEVRNSIGTLGSKTIPADVWIDGKGRLRKVRLHVAASTTTTKGSVAFEYFDLGARVNVEAPAANEVVDFQDLLGGNQSTTGPSGAAGG
jgi:LppX/LprAFG-like lipoprotein